MTTPVDPVRQALPPDAVLLAPAPPGTVPMHPPAGAWGLIVVAVRTTAATRATRADTAEVFAGVWVPEPPPADLHDGDVAVLLHESADGNPDVADVEVVAATQGHWRTVHTSRATDTQWPHEAAMPVLVHMRCLADAALKDAHWATLTGPIAAALPQRLLPAGLTKEVAVSGSRNALTALIEAGLVEVREQVEWNEHTATIHADGLLHDGGPHEFAIDTVTSLATSLAEGATVNGWYLWRRTRDGRPLSELRTELATR